MSLDYPTYVAQLANIMVIQSSDANFQTFLPGCITYAEQRIYRELDLLYTQVTDATAQVSSGNRNFVLPTTLGTFITVDNLNIIAPAGTPSSIGSRVPLTAVDRSYIDLVYPSGQTVTGTPTVFARASDTETIFGPSPDGAYYAEVVGIQRPAMLSSANSSTILTQYVPDLFVAASMVFAAGYMRDFGSQADNPGMSQSWETQYTTLMKSASVEQARAKFESEGWTSESPSPVATPSRV
jgi:hypothetical protein